jgi:hypothetical protein
MSIAFHSLLIILLISPVRIIWLAADTSGLRFREKIMKAFRGRLGVPSALRDWAIRESAKAEPSLPSDLHAAHHAPLPKKILVASESSFSF